MSSIFPRARTNLELILAQIEGLCKEKEINRESGLCSRGRPSKYSDLQIIQMVILENLLGFDSELSFIRFLGNLNQPIFISRSGHLNLNPVKEIRPQIDSLTKELPNRPYIKRSKLKGI